jgi:hypothetical protein
MNSSLEALPAKVFSRLAAQSVNNVPPVFFDCHYVVNILALALSKV